MDFRNFRNYGLPNIGAGSNYAERIEIRPAYPWSIPNMAKPTLNNEQREIVRAQNDALLRLPESRDDRLALIHGYRREKALENDKIAQAKKDVGSSETLKRLTGTYGLKPQAIRTINVLAEMAPTDRSAALRQIISHGEDEGWIIPDLFDHGAYGVGTNDDAGETGGFDKTSEGQRRGGAKAEPRTTEQMAASHEPPGTGPGLPPEEIIRRFEEANAAYLAKGGKGRKSKEFNEAKAAYDALNAQGAAPQEGEAAPVEPLAPPPEAEVPPVEKLPTAAPGQVSAEIKAGVAESEAVLAEQVAASATAREAKGPKPRTRKKVEAAPPAPPPPPVDTDDDEDDRFPTATPPAPPAPIGNQPLTGRIG